MSNSNLRVSIKVDAAVSGEAQVKSLSGELKGLGETAKQRMPDPTADIGKNAGSATASVSNLRKELIALLSIRAITSFASNVVQAAQTAEAAFKGLESVANGTGIGIQRAWQDAGEIAKQGALSQTEAASALKNLYARGFNADEALSVIKRLTDAAAFGRQSSLAWGEAVVSATEGLKNENSVLVDNAGVTENVSRMWARYAEQIGKTANELTTAEKRQAEINGILRETENQVGDTGKAMDGLRGTQNELSRSWGDLKVKLGEQFTPAMQLLTDVTIGLIDYGLTPLNNLLKTTGAQFAYLFSLAGNGVKLLVDRDWKAFKDRVATDTEGLKIAIQDIWTAPKGPAVALSARDNINAATVAARAKREAEEAAKQGKEKDKPNTPKSGGRAVGDDGRAAAQQARDLAAAQETLDQANAEAKLARTRTMTQTELAALDASFADKLVSTRAYYDEKTRLEQKAIDDEVALLQAKAARLKAAEDAGGCAEFCVNGQSTAGESLHVRKHNDNQEARRTPRTVDQPAGQLQEA